MKHIKNIVKKLQKGDTWTTWLPLDAAKMARHPNGTTNNNLRYCTIYQKQDVSANWTSIQENTAVTALTETWLPDKVQTEHGWVLVVRSDKRSMCKERWGGVEACTNERWCSHINVICYYDNDSEYVRALRCCADHVTAVIHQLFEDSVDQGLIPHEWRVKNKAYSQSYFFQGETRPVVVTVILWNTKKMKRNFLCDIKNTIDSMINTLQFAAWKTGVARMQSCFYWKTLTNTWTNKSLRHMYWT